MMFGGQMWWGPQGRPPASATHAVDKVKAEQRSYSANGFEQTKEWLKCLRSATDKCFAFSGAPLSTKQSIHPAV